MFTILAIIAWVKANAMILLLLTTGLLMFEQWLGSTAMLKSNSTAQLIYNVIQGVINVLRIVYKISTGSAMVTLLDGPKPVVAPARPAPPTAAQQMEKAIESPASALAEGEAAVFQQAFEASAGANEAALHQN